MKQNSYFSNNKSYILITCALPYVNNQMHLGHIFSTHLPASILANFFRSKDKKVILLSGSDCHGLPILKASKNWKKLNTTIDFFFRHHYLTCK